MSELNIEDFEVAFADHLNDPGLAKDFGKFLTNFVPYVGGYLGGLVSSIDLVSEVSDTIVENSFADYLKENTIEISDLRSRAGVVATFLVQDYSERPTDSADNVLENYLRVTPIGLGSSAKGALAYAMLGADEQRMLELHPVGPSKIQIGNKRFTFEGASYFTVNLENMKIDIVRRGPAENIYDQAKQSTELIGSDSFLLPRTDNSWPSALRGQYNEVRNLVASVKNSRLSALLSDAFTQNSRSLDRIADLEQKYRDAAHRAKGQRMISLISGVLQFGLSAGNYVQKRGMEDARKQQRDDLKTSFDNLTTAVEGFGEKLQEQSKKLATLAETIEDKEIIELVVPDQQIPNYHGELSNSYQDDIQQIDTYDSLEFSLGGFSFTIIKRSGSKPIDQ
ncbi:hypothetical protein [Yoonia sp. 208BN28-4]|uniref:hypothetical protein n=1 Tax=Yoonia sp. 208BN28-4 TaxID=3126505 RepID=UPI0030AC77DB